MAIIDKPTDYFSAQFWTGTGAEQSITGVDFQPDLVITKAQYATSQGYFFDAIRGATKFLTAQTNGAEATNAQTLKSFNSDGFTIGTANEVGYNGETWVAWSWLGANGTSANTDGSISSTVSANTTSGFSIVSYTGTGSVATVGHGLGVTPKMILFKNITTASNWLVYHEALGNTKNLYLDATNAEHDRSDTFNDTSPTSSVFTVGTADLNTSGNSIIAYCFNDVQGFSKFGSYTGNGNANGTFVYTGFKPAFVMTKRTDSTSNWIVLDNKRNPFNVLNVQSHLNTTASATTTTSLDFLSNGFKVRTTDAGLNASGGSYIYMCFAENPFVTSTGVPATAR
jgi:hypothetical protein